MLSYFFMGLAVFFVVTTLQTVLEIPAWAWSLATLVLAFATIGLWGDYQQWYVAFAVAGISTLILRVEALLIVKADETVANLRRRR